MNYFFDDPTEPLPDLQDESVLQSLATKVLSPLAWIGETIDKPGRALRGLIGGQGASALLNLIPFSDSLGITDPQQSVSGRDLLRQWGMADEEDTWGNFFGGIGTEILLDPLNALTLGTKGALTAAGRAALKKGELAKTATGRVASGQSGLVGLRSPFWWDMLGGPQMRSEPWLTDTAGMSVLDKLSNVRSKAIQNVPGLAKGISAFKYGAGWTGNKSFVEHERTLLAEREAAELARQGITDLFNTSREARTVLDQLNLPTGVAEDVWNRQVMQIAENPFVKSSPYFPGQDSKAIAEVIAPHAEQAGGIIRSTQDAIAENARRWGVKLKDTTSPFTDYVHRRTASSGINRLSQQTGRTVHDVAYPGGVTQLNEELLRRDLTVTMKDGKVVVEEGLPEIGAIDRMPTPEGMTEKQWGEVKEFKKGAAKERKVREMTALRDHIWNEYADVRNVPEDQVMAAKVFGDETLPPEKIAKWEEYQRFKKSMPFLEHVPGEEDVLQKLASPAAPTPQSYVGPAPAGPAAAPAMKPLPELLANWSKLKKADKQAVSDWAIKMDLPNDPQLQELFTHQQILKSAKKYGVAGDDLFQDVVEAAKSKGQLLKVGDIEHLKNLNAGYFQLVDEASKSGGNAILELLQKLPEGKRWDKYADGVRGILERKIADDPDILQRLAQPAKEAIPQAETALEKLAKPVADTSTEAITPVLKQNPKALLSDRMIQKIAGEEAEHLANVSPEVIQANRGYYKPDPLLALTEYAGNLAKQTGVATSVLHTLAASAKPESAYAVSDLADRVSLLDAIDKVGASPQSRNTLKQLINPDLTPERIMSRSKKVTRLTDRYVPRELVEDLGKEMAGPKGLMKLGEGAEKYGGWLRSWFTLPFAPYHIRNLWEGAVASGIHGGLSPTAYRDVQSYLRGTVKDPALLKELDQFAAEAYGSGAALRGQALDYMGKSVVNEEQRAIAPWVKQEGQTALEQTKGFLSGYKQPLKSYLSPNSKVNPLTQQGLKIHQNVDDMNRLAQFVGLRRQGYDVKAASEIVQTAQLDYNMLSPFEQNVMRNVLPFYAFSRGNLRRLAAQTANPGPTATMARMFGSAGQEAAVPGFVSPGGSIPVPGGEDGKQRYMSGFSLPVEDEVLLSLASLGQFDPMGAAKRALTAGNPLTKLLTTFATGQQIFSGRPLDEVKANPLVSLGGLIPNRPAVLAGEALAATPLGRFITTGNAAINSSDQNILLKLLTGVRTTDVDPQMATRLAAEDYVRDQLKATGMVKSRQVVYPRQEYREAENQPVELQKLLELMRGLEQQKRQAVAK